MIILDMERALKDNVSSSKCYEFLEVAQFVVIETRLTRETQ